MVRKLKKITDTHIHVKIAWINVIHETYIQIITSIIATKFHVKINLLINTFQVHQRVAHALTSHYIHKITSTHLSLLPLLDPVRTSLEAVWS